MESSLGSGVIIITPITSLQSSSGHHNLFNFLSIQMLRNQNDLGECEMARSVRKKKIKLPTEAFQAALDNVL